MACVHVFTHLPTIISSHSEERDLKIFQTSMVKSVLALLKMEVREDMRAAIITAIINPLRPGREHKGSDMKQMLRGAYAVRTEVRTPHLQAAAP